MRGRTGMVRDCRTGQRRAARAFTDCNRNAHGSPAGFADKRLCRQATSVDTGYLQCLHVRPVGGKRTRHPAAYGAVPFPHDANALAGLWTRQCHPASLNGQSPDRSCASVWQVIMFGIIVDISGTLVNAVCAPRLRQRRHHDKSVGRIAAGQICPTGTTRLSFGHAQGMPTRRCGNRIQRRIATFTG